MNKVALGLALFATAQAEDVTVAAPADTTAPDQVTDAAVVQTDAEVVQTVAEVVQTVAEVVQTDAEVVQTVAEVVQTDAEVAQTDAEVVQTDAEAVQTVVGEPVTNFCDYKHLEDLIQKRTFKNKFAMVKTDKKTGLPKVQCKKNHKVKKADRAPICVDGEWKLPESEKEKPAMFRCVPETCNIEWEQENPCFNNVTFTEDCNMKCDAGFVLDGARAEFDWEEGVWNGSMDFKCIEKVKPKCTEKSLQTTMLDNKLVYDKKTKEISCNNEKFQVKGEAECKDGMWFGLAFCEKVGKVCSKEAINEALTAAELDAEVSTYIPVRSDAQALCKENAAKVTVSCSKDGEVSIDGDCTAPKVDDCRGLKERVASNGGKWVEGAQEDKKWMWFEWTQGAYECKGSGAMMEVKCYGGYAQVVSTCPIMPTDGCLNFVGAPEHSNEVPRYVNNAKIGKKVMKSCRKGFHIENLFDMDARAEKIEYECKLYGNHAVWHNVHGYKCVEDEGEEEWNPKMVCAELPTGLVAAGHGLEHSFAEGHIATFECPKGSRNATGLSAVSLVCKSGNWSAFYAISIQASVRCIKEVEEKEPECNASSLPFFFYTQQLIRTNLWTTEWSVVAGMTRKMNCKAGFQNEDGSTEADAVCQGGKWVFANKACSIPIVPEPKLECATEIKAECARVLVESSSHHNRFCSWAPSFVNFCTITVEKMAPTEVIDCETKCVEEIQTDAIFRPRFTIFQRSRKQTCYQVCHKALACERRRMLESSPVIV